MPKLKNSIISEILCNLNYGDFCREDFKVEFPDESSILAKLIFTALPKYTFTIEEHNMNKNRLAAIGTAFQSSESKKVIRTVERPGDYQNDECHSHESIDFAVSRIVKWVKNIREDIVYSRVLTKTGIDAFVAEFQSNLDEKIENPEDYFKDEEKVDLIRKLEELQTRIELLEAEVGLDPQQAKIIEQAIEKSKSDIEVYPKGVWYRTAGTKLIKLLKGAISTKEGRQITADIVKKLMS